MAFHLRGIVLPDDEERDLYVVGDRLTFAPVASAEGAGPWLAATGRFFPGWSRQVDLAALPEVAVEEAKASGGWCKVIAD